MPWFPSLGTLDLGTWERVGSKLEKLLCKGVPLPVSIWSIWTLIKSILEPLQTPESSEGSKDEGAAAAAKLLQLCQTQCGPTDSSPPGSPVPGILQARSLEWVAISFSKDEGETPSRAEPEYGKPEGIEQKHRRLSKL